MSSHSDHIPKKARPSDKPSKKCKLCEKHGGKPLTHYTNECKKYNTDGTIKEGFGRGGKGSPKDAKAAKKEKAHYAQLSREIKAKIGRASCRERV